MEQPVDVSADDITIGAERTVHVGTALLRALLNQERSRRTVYICLSHVDFIA